MAAGGESRNSETIPSGNVPADAGVGGGDVMASQDSDQTGGGEDGPPLEVIMGAEDEVSGEMDLRFPSDGRSAGEENTAGEKPLPGMDDLVSRIPAEVRDALDALFRGRFVRVTRVPPSVLTKGSAHGPKAL